MENLNRDIKKLDIVSWRVNKAKEESHHNAVHKALFERPRLRRDTQH